jgi:predicted RNA-binding Zn-ribbon protein involved in translation (DUF1610 family)
MREVRCKTCGEKLQVAEEGVDFYAPDVVQYVAGQIVFKSVQEVATADLVCPNCGAEYFWHYKLGLSVRHRGVIDVVAQMAQAAEDPLALLSAEDEDHSECVDDRPEEDLVVPDEEEEE